MGWLWGVGLCGIALAEGDFPQVAQADGNTGELPVISAGPQNPQLTLELHEGITGLSALQFTVTAPPTRPILIDTVAIGFGIPFGEEVTTGDEDLLDELHARLVLENIAINGIQDEGEVSEGTQSITDLEDPATVLFPLNPPLPLAAGTAVTFLVVVDINEPASGLAAANPLHQAWWLLFPIIGFISYAGCSILPARRLCLIVLILFSCSLMLVGCSGDDDELRFVVNLPSNGLTGVGQRLGPETAVAGTTIRLMK
jgi:hypothetical protein